MVNSSKVFLLMAALSGLFMVAGQVMGGQSGMVMAFAQGTNSLMMKS